MKRLFCLSFALLFLSGCFCGFSSRFDAGEEIERPGHHVNPAPKLVHEASKPA